MKKTLVSTCVLGLLMAGGALAAEFQPMGTLGIGGAGVARTFDSHAPYWNPAGLAFNDKSFSSRIDASVGLKVNEGLADNVDRLSNLNFDTFSKYNAGSTTAQAVTDTVKALSILGDIKEKKGTLAVNGNAVLGFQIKHFAFGAFGTFEGFAQPVPDTANILPNQDSTSTAVTPVQLWTPVAGSAASNVFFSSQQRTDIEAALTTNNQLTATQARDIINAADAQLAGSGISSQAATNSLVTLGQTLANPGTRTLDNNTSSVLTKSLAYIEFPLSYGHAIPLGSFGTLGIGATAKVLTGRVYQSQTYLLKSGTKVESSDIVSDMTDNFKDSTALGFDLGALWRPKEWINVGIVAKHLNSPKFDAPDLKDKNGSFLPGSGGKVKLKPQVRMGVAVDPLSWLTLAADVDLTNNETVLTSNNYRSRNIGGGFEWHYFSWFKVRGGMYSNIAEKGIGPTATAGITFGTKWINLDIDGAYGLETAKYKDRSYPQEARVQTQINFLF
ncbi:conjugal transfer protein TraF [Geotalea sp. SG265]|uniref:conjugal transfer protein TraF n=1 Tax=Geotalea sp. SG265 TaxID=2922867 RepID=UPI001FAF0E61|nr:conjugal transfer protein TraF [Geotalea sp. SG265]